MLVLTKAFIVAAALTGHCCATFTYDDGSLTPNGGSLLSKRQAGGKADLVLPATKITDGLNFEIIVDGAHLCGLQNLGPLMSKDLKTVKDFNAQDYYNNEIWSADGPTRVAMIEKNCKLFAAYVFMLLRKRSRS